MGSDWSPVAVAEAAATAARGVPDVVDLHHGVVGEFATYGSGRRVGGVRVERGATPRATVHIVVRYGRPVTQVADEVRAAVVAALAHQWPALAGTTVDLLVADLAPADAEPASGAPEALTATTSSSAPRRQHSPPRPSPSPQSRPQRSEAGTTIVVTPSGTAVADPGETPR